MDLRRVNVFPKIFRPAPSGHQEEAKQSENMKIIENFRHEESKDLREIIYSEERIIISRSLHRNEESLRFTKKKSNTQKRR
jgi:hypothetical protein